MSELLCDFYVTHMDLGVVPKVFLLDFPSHRTVGSTSHVCIKNDMEVTEQSMITANGNTTIEILRDTSYQAQKVKYFPVKLMKQDYSLFRMFHVICFNRKKKSTSF